MTNDSDIQNLISSESKMFSFSIEDIQTIFKECDKELDILYSIFLNIQKPINLKLNKVYN